MWLTTDFIRQKNIFIRVVMKVFFKILLCSLILYACANSGEQAQTLSTQKSAEIIPEASVAVDHKNAAPNKTTKEESPAKTDVSKASATPVKYEEETPRQGSTIAEQQEAARRIQNELARRSPQPDEEQVQEGAVFEKVISHKSDKPQVDKTKKEVKTKVAEKPTKKKTTPKKKAVQKLKKPAIEFKELTMTFDTITEGDLFDHKFVFTNTGNAPLEIKSATASCGCTQPSYPFIPVEPNEQGHIAVRYNSVGKEGDQKPEVSILTNIDKNEIILYLEGFVVKKEEEEK